MKILILGSTIYLLIAALLAPAMADPVQSDTSDTLIAQAHKAARAWRDACTDKTSDESCITLQSPKKTQSCRKSLELLRPGQRRADSANKAHRSLLLALDGLAREPQSEAVQATVAEAQYLIAEAAFLQFLAIKAPVGLNFDPRNTKRSRRSQQAFLDFFERAKNTAQEAHKAYSQVTELSNNQATQAWRVAAMGQRARIYRHFAELFYSMEVPIDVRTGSYAEEATDAFCDALAEQALPLEELGIQSAQSCVAASEGMDSPWRSKCQELIRPLGELDDPATVRYTIRAQMPAFKGCYEQAKRKQSDLVGTLKLQLRIDGDGQVVHASATGMGGRDLQSCVTKAAKSLLFPPARGPEATLIDYPLRFGVVAPRP